MSQLMFIVFFLFSLNVRPLCAQEQESKEEPKTEQQTPENNKKKEKKEDEQDKADVEEPEAEEPKEQAPQEDELEEEEVEEALPEEEPTPEEEVEKEVVEEIKAVEEPEIEAVEEEPVEEEEPEIEAVEEESVEEEEPEIEEVAPTEEPTPEEESVKEAEVEKVMPELPVKEEKEEPAPEEEVVLEGIDTVDINEPEGNWLFKRIWWQKSKDLYGKIRERVDKIVESRMHFFNERVKIDRQLLDPFYREIGLDQGTLRTSVAFLLEHLEKERERKDILDEQELEYYHALKEGKITLEKLDKASLDVQQLDNAIQEALQKLMEQINLARSYERESWELLNEIAEELNDKKAREHYYTIATLWRNVKDIANYIQGPFAQHFVQLASMIIQRVQEIEQAIGVLKEKGIDIKERIELKEEEEKEVEEPEIEDEIEPEVPAQGGWLGWLWQQVTGPFRWLGQKITGLFTRG